MIIIELATPILTIAPHKPKKSVERMEFVRAEPSRSMSEFRAPIWNIQLIF